MATAAAPAPNRRVDSRCTCGAALFTDGNLNGLYNGGNCPNNANGQNGHLFLSGKCYIYLEFACFY